MFVAVLTRLFGSLARRWQRVLLVELLVLACLGVIGGFFGLLLYGYPDVALLASLATVGLVVVGQGGVNWVQAAGVRAASGTSGLLASTLETIGAGLRLLVAAAGLNLVLVALALVHPLLALPWLLLVLVPACVAVGDAALNPGSWGLRAAWRLGFARMGRNVGAWLGAVVGGALILVLASALLLGPVLALGGAPPTASADLEAWATDAMLGLVIGGILAAVLLSVAWPALTWAVYAAVSGDVELFAHEDVEAATVEHEISSVVAALLGSAATTDGTSARASGPRRRMQVPPRAEQPGRIPGPGVLSVTDVALPPGVASRPVDAPTLELDVFDEAPMTTQGAVVAPSAPAMWVSSQPVPNATSAWKQLAAGFAESGLWPLLLPAAEVAVREPWHEQRARRDRDSVDATAAELVRSRLEGSLRDSPLASTDDIAASGAGRGQLGRGSGRRADAIDHAFAAVGAAHLALVGVRRPADAVHRVAWPGSEAAAISGVELAEVIASWEERYGALLVGLGTSRLTFAVVRPPMTLDEALEAAAEHHALCPDECDAWGDDRTYAATLVDTPVWQLTWT